MQASLVAVATAHHGIHDVGSVLVSLMDGIVAWAEQQAKIYIIRTFFARAEETVVPLEVYLVDDHLHGLLALLVERQV